MLVVDDYEPWRRFYCSALQKRSEFQVIDEVSDGLEAVQQALQLQPDLILLDIGLPSLNGIEAARQIRDLSPASMILFITENRSPDIVEQALRTGSRGYVVKSDAASELLPAIDAVLGGKQFVSTCLKDYSIDDADPDCSDKVVAPTQLQSIDCHGLKLCTDNSAFVDGFAQSIETTLESGNASVVIVTESHHSELVQKLKSNGVDVDIAVQKGLLAFVDVDSLRTVMGGAATDENPSAGSTRMPEVILDALQTAKARHLHVAVG